MQVRNTSLRKCVSGEGSYTLNDSFTEKRKAGKGAGKSLLPYRFSVKKINNIRHSFLIQIVNSI